MCGNVSFRDQEANQLDVTGESMLVNVQSLIYLLLLLIVKTPYFAHCSHILPTLCIGLFCMILKLITLDNKFQTIFCICDEYFINLFASMKLENGHKKDYLALVLKLCFTMLFYEIG